LYNFIVWRCFFSYIVYITSKGHMIIMHNEVKRLLAYITKHFPQTARCNTAESNDNDLSKIRTLYSVEWYCDCEWRTVWEEKELRETIQGCRTPDRVENKIRKGKNDNHSSTTISMNMQGDGRGLIQSNPTILTSASRH
jgi:hypothetical protein